MARKKKDNSNTKKYDDYVYFKYDRDGLFREGLFFIHCYKWLMRNYDTDDCGLDIEDENGKIHYIQFDPKTFMISFEKEDIEKFL